MATVCVEAVRNNESTLVFSAVWCKSRSVSFLQRLMPENSNAIKPLARVQARSESSLKTMKTDRKGAN